MLIKVFQAGDMPQAVAAAAAVGFKPGAAPRADSLVYPQELTQVMGKQREVYRPRKWRRYIGVEPVATWAQFIEDRRYRSYVEDPVNLTNKSPTQELPMPAFDTSNQTLPIYEFGYAYAYFDRDVELAAHLGISLSTENIEAVNLGAENFLEKVASVGHTANGVTLKGLCNLADLGSATAVTKAATGTTWAVATVQEIVKDLHGICNAVEVASKETEECDRILLPLSQWQTANQVRSDSLERSAIAIFKAERPGVEISVWNRLSDQGAGSTPCAMGWASKSPFAPKMLMQRELQFGQALRGTNGWLVPGKLATGGVRCLNPACVIKMSGL